MALARQALLALSTNAWLRDRATTSRVVRRSVSQFMPGERLEDALRAARDLAAGAASAILTHLGENLADDAQADAVAAHYLHVLDRIAASELDAHVSVKPTQLGLDIDGERCRRRLETIVDHAGTRGQFVWLDMESSGYVDRTLDLFRRVRDRSSSVGVALQAYLHRTGDDLEALMPLRPVIRLVKGAYLEPVSLARRTKREVDDAYLRYGVRLLEAAAQGQIPLVHMATHDPRLVARLCAFADQRRVPAGACEHAMLYGIQRRLQVRLAAEGRRVRVLVAYGENWFPWFMRRLAERPANLGLLMRNLRR